MWRSYAVNAWPTLAVIDRNGYVVGAHQANSPPRCSSRFFGCWSRCRRSNPGRFLSHFPAEKPGIAPSFLKYPEKIAVDSERIAISDTGKARTLAGTGKQMRTGSDHDEGALSSPWDLSVVEQTIYVADAESSAIRWADVDADGMVGTIVGAGLFDFGDADGIGEEVRMQHQQGVARRNNGDLLVADSYNDALRWVNVETREARSWLRGFHEPGGVA